MLQKFRVIAAEQCRTVNRQLRHMIRRMIQAYEAERGPILLETDHSQNQVDE